MKLDKNPFEKTLTLHKTQVITTGYACLINILAILAETTNRSITQNQLLSVARMTNYIIIAAAFIVSLTWCISKHETELYQQFDKAAILFLLTFIIGVFYPATFDPTDMTIELCAQVGGQGLFGAILTKVLAIILKQPNPPGLKK